MLELLINRRLRQNYNYVLKLENAESIKTFLSELSEREKNELFAYTYGYAVKDRMKAGFPITEYFLLHYDDFIPDITKLAYEKADKHLNYILIITVVAICIYVLT